MALDKVLSEETHHNFQVLVQSMILSLYLNGYISKGPCLALYVQVETKAGAEILVE